MNLGEAKKKALSLMAEYSVDGVPIPDGENADYLNRMNRFANDAQMEISDKVSIEAVLRIDQISINEPGYYKYPLPADYKELRYMNREDERFSDFRIENRKLMLKKVHAGAFELSYIKNPEELSSSTPDTYLFEVDLHAQHLIPYFMGGMAITDENPTLSDKLLNLYYSKLAALAKKYDDHPNTIQIDYGL